MLRILENFFTIDLLTDDDNKCVGIIGYEHQRGIQIIWAANTILATGGAGRLYRETTNPEVATGDGIEVDSHLRSTDHNVYAAGDVAMSHKFTHAADAAARIVIQNALFGGRKRVRRRRK